MADFGDHYHVYAESFRRAGLAVDRAIHKQTVAYASVGDVVFMLLVAPWEIPDFDPERELEALLALEEACGTEAGIVLTEVRYLLTAHKPDQAAGGAAGRLGERRPASGEAGEQALDGDGEARK